MKGRVPVLQASNDSPWALEQALASLRRDLRRFPFDRVISHVFPLDLRQLRPKSPSP